MPGLCGFSGYTGSSPSPAGLLKKMCDDLTYRRRHRTDTLFSDTGIAASRVHLGIVNGENQPFAADECAVWIDGEFYGGNREDHESDPSMLARCCAGDNLCAFLRQCNGVFSAVMYDKKRRHIHLISDRFGLKPLYLCRFSGTIAWASELKPFRHFPSLSLSVSRERIGEFLNNGHLSGNATWFDDVTLLPPSTVFTWDLNSSTGSWFEYWSWNKTEEQTGPTHFDDAVQRLGTLFKKAVSIRCRPGERIGLGLSGGLDSRALFAAVPSFLEPVPVYTFGRKGCGDIAIARKVSRLRPSRHTIQILNAGTWLTNRIEGVWLTDGQYNLLHMHGIEQIDALGNLFDIELNGFLGDALLGGSYCGRNKNETELFNNRGRRFIALGLTLGNIAYHTRMPFTDNFLIDMIRSVPLNYRRNSLLYTRMLLKEFSDYFSAIPWQKTGVPISSGKCTAHFAMLQRKARFRLSKYLPGLSSSGDYFDYGNWIRAEPAGSLFKKILSNKDALINEFVEPAKIRRTLENHLKGGDRSELLGRYITLEIWMQRFFNNRHFRTSDSRQPEGTCVT